MLRSTLFACAAMFAMLAPANAEQQNARCEDMSFRVYFAHGSAQLDDTAMQMLALAERNVAGCAYAELHVAFNASAPLANERGRAILAAADGRAWNVTRVERMQMQRASMSSSPDFAQVTMSSRVMPVAPQTTTSDVGV